MGFHRRAKVSPRQQLNQTRTKALSILLRSVETRKKGQQQRGKRHGHETRCGRAHIDAVLAAVRPTPRHSGCQHMTPKSPPNSAQVSLYWYVLSASQNMDTLDKSIHTFGDVLTCRACLCLSYLCPCLSPCGLDRDAFDPET